MASSSSAAATPVVTPATRRSRFDSTTSTSTNQSVSSVASGGGGGGGAMSSLMMMSASSNNSRVSSAMTSARGDDDDDDYAQRIVIRLRSCKPKEHEELVRVHLSHELELAGPSVEGVLEPPKRSRRERLLSKTRNKLGLVEHSEYTHTPRVTASPYLYSLFSLFSSTSDV